VLRTLANAVTFKVGLIARTAAQLRPAAVEQCVARWEGGMQCNVPICLCTYHFCCSCFVSGAAQGAGVQAGIFISMLIFIVTLP
jgi:hypothetical protein